MEDSSVLTYVGAQVDKLSPRVERLLSAAANQSSGAGQLQVDLESASLQQPGQAKAAEQVRVDQESAQLQQAGMQGVVKEMRVDAQAEQLQQQQQEGPAQLAQARVDREVEQLQTQAQDGEEQAGIENAVPSSGPPSDPSEAAAVERVAVAGKRTAVKELAEKSVQVLMGIDECTVLGLMHTDYCGFPHVHVDQWALRDACTPRPPCGATGSLRGTWRCSVQSRSGKGRSTCARQVHPSHSARWVPLRQKTEQNVSLTVADYQALHEYEQGPCVLKVRDCLEALKQGRSWVPPQLVTAAGALDNVDVEAAEVGNPTTCHTAWTCDYPSFLKAASTVQKNSARTSQDAPPVQVVPVDDPGERAFLPRRLEWLVGTRTGQGKR